MKKIIKNEKGITLTALVITIVILGIIASITIYSGKDTIKRANLESIKTNMMLIEAKAREIVEEANFKLGPNFDSSTEEGATKLSEVRKNVYEDTEGLKKVSELSSITIPSEIPQDTSVYWVTQETMEKWGLSKIELEDGEAYLIKFDETSVKVEIYNNIGFNNKYSLSDINQIEL